MKLVEYIKETRAEMRHVTWPTRKQAVNYTFLVIGVSIATALVLALADKIFTLGLERIILNN
jgi:preprotein translocase subunit SecE